MNNLIYQQLFNYTDPIIRKALKRCGLYRTNPEYEDLYQELRIKVLLLTSSVSTVADFRQKYSEDYLLNQFMWFGLTYMGKVWQHKHQEVPRLLENQAITPPIIDGVIIRDIFNRFWASLTLRERQIFILIWVYGDDLIFPAGLRQHYQYVFKKKYNAL